MYYTIYLNFIKRIKEYILPSGDAERYRIDISEEAEKENCFISFERHGDVWHVLSDEMISVSESDKLENGKAVEFSIKGTIHTGAAIAVKMNGRFEKYRIKDRVKIGKAADSDVVIDSELVSHSHAEIVKTNDEFVIRDHSSNGTFVNGLRLSGEMKEQRLEMFDSVWIFGAKIIFLGGIIAINENENITSSLKKAEKLSTEKNIRRIRTEPADIVRDCSSGYDISPVMIYPLNVPAPEKSVHSFSGILRAVVPSFAVLSAAYAFTHPVSLPVLSAYFAGGSAAVSVLWYVAEKTAHSFAEKKNAADRKLMIEKHLENYRIKAEEKKNQVRAFLEEKYICADKAVCMYREGKQIIRDFGSEDFLKITVGKGNEDFRKYIQFNGACSSEIRALADDLSVVGDVPQILDLKNEKTLKISGKTETVSEFITACAVKISAFHDCREVRIMLFSTGEYRNCHEVFRWLPHAYSEDRAFRYTSCEKTSYPHLLSLIDSILRSRSEKRKNGFTEEFLPHLVVFCTNEKIFRDDPVMRYCGNSENLGVTFIYAENSDSEVLSIKGSKTNFRMNNGESDLIKHKNALSYARLRAGISDSEKYTAPVPEKLTFLEMYGAVETESISPVYRYPDMKASEGIRACIGFGEDNIPFCLDLHESKHGPHGLIAGTTGSGKSEFIMTMILSLALNYSPDEISFVLIDYKGGGMSGVFEDLPHTAGVLTNLSDDINQVGRVLISLRSEIKRRQTVFRNYGVSHADSYMELYRAGRTDEPMPHIIIICDEFAELKRENPEFISQLVSISRVGRSLGIHLILATQKPSGVVDEEIWSNSGFRICLKVQDRSDSIGMLRHPDAADITVTGRAWVQVGNDEIYELVQTGFSGADYDTSGRKYEVRMIRDTGSAAVAKTNQKKEKRVTQLEAVKNMINSYCLENGVKPARKLWKPPLPLMPYLSDILEKYRLRERKNALVFTAGLTDDPENQSVYPAEFDMYECCSILLAGQSGSGKTTFLITALCSLADNYSPEIFKFSVVDFSGGLFSVFAKLPQCRKILSSPDEYELSEFFDMISGEIQRRKQIFADVNSADFNEYREQCSDLCAEIILLDGYYLFREIYPAYEEKFNLLSGESAKYGIYFIVTVKQLSDMKMRTRQNFRTAAALALNDRTEYTELLGIRPQTELRLNTGCGFLRQDRRILEFQTAVCCSGSGRERTEQLSLWFEKIKSAYSSAEEKPDEKFCVFENLENEIQYMDFIKKNSLCRKTFVWSPSEQIQGEETENSFRYYGSEGAFELLVKLSRIFKERSTCRKISGTYEGEDIDVVFCSFGDFCACIYEEGREDMKNITEKFLDGGKGLGIRFISGKAENGDYSALEKFRLNSEGGRDA